MSDWIDIKDEEPMLGQNVIAVGTWWGEINGDGDEGYMGIGAWGDGAVHIDSDTYSTNIHSVTHWMPLPEWPEEPPELFDGTTADLENLAIWERQNES